MILKIIGRDEAQAVGLTRFYTGRPCRRGHVAERYTSMGGCLDCLNRKRPKTLVSVFTPINPIYFKSASALEAQAAFRYVELAGWYDAALTALRADPDLMARCIAPLSGRQRANLAVADNARKAELAKLLG